MAHKTKKKGGAKAKAKANKPKCGLCGKSGKLIKTECCGNWICDDYDNYVLFSYARNSCSRNHDRYTLCAYHYHEGHAGRWQDCRECRDSFMTEMYVWYGTNEYNFETLENPPAFEPTQCSVCGKVIHLGTEGYSQLGEDFKCARCSEEELKRLSESADRADRAPAQSRRSAKSRGRAGGQKASAAAKSKATKKRTKAADATHFFEQELKGERPLTRATAERLYDLSGEFFARRPWELLADVELILMETPDAQEICYCSVMGAAGQVFALQAYLGRDGFRIFKRIEDGEEMTPPEFYASMRGVQVELVPHADLTTPDRKLLRALGHAFKKHEGAPVFRSYRPGYDEWYISEDEGLILASCIESVTAFCDVYIEEEDVDYWYDDNIYPFIRPVSAKGDDQKFEIVCAEVDSPPAPPLELPALDSDQITRVRDQGYPVRGIMEVEHFYTGGRIGRKHERKACVHTVLAIDAASGLAYRPLVGVAADTAGALLVRTVLGAIDTGRAIPLEVQVKDTATADLLGPLANELGFSARVAKSLPALGYAKKEMLRMLGEMA